MRPGATPRKPINDDNFEKFFGYPGKARRNLPQEPGSAHR